MKNIKLWVATKKFYILTAVVTTALIGGYSNCQMQKFNLGNKGSTSLNSSGGSSSAAIVPSYIIFAEMNLAASAGDPVGSVDANCPAFTITGFAWNVQDQANKRQDTCLIQQAGVYFFQWYNAYVNSPVADCSTEFDNYYQTRGAIQQ